MMQMTDMSTGMMLGMVLISVLIIIFLILGIAVYQISPLLRTRRKHANN